MKKAVLRNFTKFTGKYLYQNFFFNKAAGFRTLAQVFSCEFCEISKNIFYRTPLTTASVVLLFAGPASNILNNSLALMTIVTAELQLDNN